jgi:NTE family protein
VDGGLLNPLPIVPVVSTHADLIVAVNLNATNQRQYSLPVIERPAALKGRFDSVISGLSHKLSFFRRGEAESPPELIADALLHPVPAASEEPAEPEMQQPAAAPQAKGSPRSATGSHVIDSSSPASLLELVNQSFEVMQTSLAQYKIAGYPPDILINVPKRVCRFFEFYKAPELIALGRQIASDTLDRYEAENPY